MQKASTPRQIFRPNGLLGWSLSPNSELRVPFRESAVIQHIDASGWRRVCSAEQARGPRLGVYGCSYVYGTGLKDEETLCSLLQAQRPDLTLRNRGVGGHGTVQAYLQLRDDLRQGRSEGAIIGVISDHLYRNRPHPYRMQAFLDPLWSQIGIEYVPQALRRRDGGLQIEMVSCWQPSLRQSLPELFLPSIRDLSDLLIDLLKMITELGTQYGVPVLVALLDQIDPDFNRAVLRCIPEAIDVSVPHTQEFTFMPLDIHPNAEAQLAFARGLSAPLRMAMPPL